jgi:hypothetical protein
VSHANCLELGDNFASSVDPNNVEEVEFELLKAPIRVELQFTSDWGEHSMLLEMGDWSSKLCLPFQDMCCHYTC